MPDLRLPSQSQDIAAPRLVPNYTAWWQKHMCVNNLPKVVTWPRKSRELNPRPVKSQANALVITPPGHHACPYDCAADLNHCQVESANVFKSRFKSESWLWFAHHWKIATWSKPSNILFKYVYVNRVLEPMPVFLCVLHYDTESLIYAFTLLDQTFAMDKGNPKISVREISYLLT